jgi:thiamine transport system permease protein
VLIFLLFLLAPLITLALRSFSLGDQGWTMRYYWALTENPRQSAFFFPPLSAVGNSLWIASVTTLLSLLLGLAAAYLLVQRQGWLSVILDPLFLLPLGSSAVTLGFGYIVTMGSLRASPWLTPIAHTLIAMPFVVRTLLPALRRIDPKLRQAAMVLGAPPARLWREIDAPLLWRTVVVGAVFAFAISLGEFGATLLVGRPEQPTMPMVIYQALSKPGLLNYGQALAMSTILMVVCVVALVVIERLRLPGEDF